MDHNKRSQLSRRLVAVMMGALLQAPLVAHAQDQQTAAEIASSGIEIPKVRVQDDELSRRHLDFHGVRQDLVTRPDRRVGRM